MKQIRKHISTVELEFNVQALSKRFNKVCFFDSNAGSNKKQGINYSQILALGSSKEFVCSSNASFFDNFHKLISESKSWWFGYFCFEALNKKFHLNAGKVDLLQFPEFHFFIPQLIFLVTDNEIQILFDEYYFSEIEAEKIFYENSSFKKSEDEKNLKLLEKIDVKNRISKNEYISSIEHLKQLIQVGDIYEINFCQEFYSEISKINSVGLFKKLNSISKSPFSAYCKFDNKYLMCSSPERFIQKKGGKIISQPIKGTSGRNQNLMIDQNLKIELENSEKDKSENVMIVDLVRNDLSKIAKRGSVHVDELFKVYSFRQVHQMISTISCEIENEISFGDIINATFPMGSMTGAPKHSAMQLIQKFESSKRGLYSGSVGYIDPDGDFDFNVVIRSILYNESTKYLSFTVGSAITNKSIAEEEYDECMLKAKAMFEVLENK